jgi:enoyl-CoA hydratase/carnithine racemase
MSEAGSDRVRFEPRGAVALVQMDDGKVNALSPALLAELGAAFDRAEKEASALVLAGRPGCFSAGFDLKVMQQGPDATRRLVRAGAELALRMAEFPKPVVAACSGHALAMGALLLCASDLRVGAEGDFQIGLNEVAIGMTLPIFGVELARQRLSRRHLTRAAALAELYDPRGAVDAGYLDRMVPAESVVAAAVTDAERLAALHAGAFRATKARLHPASLAAIRESLDRELPR